MCFICRFLCINTIHIFVTLIPSVVSHQTDTRVCLGINLVLGNWGISNILQVSVSALNITVQVAFFLLWVISSGYIPQSGITEAKGTHSIVAFY